MTTPGWPDTAHFIADVHLVGDDTPCARRLAGYLAGPARTAAAVYILGDLFDVWVGDDGSMATHTTTLDGLSALAATRVPVYFQRGNRDFAVGRAFFEHTGLRPLADPIVHRIAGRPTLLAHGDVFCSDDTAHQVFRGRYTNPHWRRWMLKVPLPLRRRLAQRARRRSQQAKMTKPDAIMDVNAETVRSMAADADTMRIVHGHTHRPADHHDHGLDRYVLADWQPDRAEVLTISRRGVARRALDENGAFAEPVLPT